MPKSKIKSCDFKRESVSSFGTFYIFILELEDGTRGDYFSKEREIKKSVGDEIEYTYEPNANPSYLGKIKEVAVVKKPTNFIKKNESAENARLSLLIAKDIFIHDTANNDIFELAEKYFFWLENKSKNAV